MSRDTLVNFTLLVPVLLGSACGEEPEPIVETNSQAGVFEAGARWQKDDLVVCWEPDAMVPALAAGRQITQQAIFETWDSVSRINFQGWEPCATTADPDIRITNAPLVSFSQFGRRSRGKSPSMGINLSCHVPPGGCLNLDPEPHPGNPGVPPGTIARCNGILVDTGRPPDLTTCVRALAVHEFGHALGLRHEQVHDDSTCSFRREVHDYPAEGIDGENLWEFDAESVMSYCTFTSKLATGDIRSISSMYPWGVIAFDDANFKWAIETFGPGTFAATTVSRLALTDSIVVPAGMEATLCSTAGCWTFTSSQRTLPAALGGRVTALGVRPFVTLAEDQGFRGVKQQVGVGIFAGDQGGLSRVGNDRMSSLFMPHGFTVKLCQHEASQTTMGECGSFANGPRIVEPPLPHPRPGRGPGPEPLWVKLPSALDNNVSFVEVTSTVSGYHEHNFRGGGASFAVGAHVGAKVARLFSLAIPPWLEVEACNGVDANGNGAGTCRVYQNSLNLPPDHIGRLQYLRVRVRLVVQLPPNPNID